MREDTTLIEDVLGFSPLAERASRLLLDARQRKDWSEQKSPTGPLLQEVEMEARSVMPLSSGRKTAGRPTWRGRGMKTLAALSLSLAIYGMAGWIYVAVCALVAPDTLHLPLTHLLPFLREDTSGVLSFILSFVSFVVYQMIRDELQRSFCSACS